jgi:hypothetical protein
VQISSPDFAVAPAIAPNYLSTDADRKVAADSLRLTRTIVGQPALAKYQPQEFKPGLQFQTDDELARLAGDIATTIFHPVATTKMGRDDDPLAVLDARMRVRGPGGLVAGLRVVDAGAMPLDHQRQHQRTHLDDGGEGGALDHRRRENAQQLIFRKGISQWHSTGLGRKVCPSLAGHVPAQGERPQEIGPTGQTTKKASVTPVPFLLGSALADRRGTTAWPDAAAPASRRWAIAQA